MWPPPSFHFLAAPQSTDTLLTPKNHRIMAKIVGVSGTMYGKAAGFVYYKGEDGLTNFRAYQPKVANPRTDLQILQRAKMNTVGQFSALCPAALLSPLGKGTKRKNRSAFSRNLLYKATAELVEGGAKASIAPEDVIFSKGSQQLLTEASTPVVDESSVSVTLTPNIPTELLGRYGERIVVAILDAATNEQYDAVIFKDTTIETNTAQTVDLDISGVPLQQGQTVVVWRMAFRLAAAAAGLSGDGIHIGTDGITATIGSSSTRITVDEWGRTVHVATVPFAAGV